MQIYAGLPVTEVARLAGHGVEVCLRYYARPVDRAHLRHGVPLADAARAEVAVDGLSGLVEDAVETRLAVLPRAGRDTHRLGG